eukprot:403375995
MNFLNQKNMQRMAMAAIAGGAVYYYTMSNKETGRNFATQRGGMKTNQQVSGGGGSYDPNPTNKDINYMGQNFAKHQQTTQRTGAMDQQQKQKDSQQTTTH